MEENNSTSRKITRPAVVTSKAVRISKRRMSIHTMSPAMKTGMSRGEIWPPVTFKKKKGTPVTSLPVIHEEEPKRRRRILSSTEISRGMEDAILRNSPEFMKQWEAEEKERREKRKQERKALRLAQASSIVFTPEEENEPVFIFEPIIELVEGSETLQLINEEDVLESSTVERQLEPVTQDDEPEPEHDSMVEIEVPMSSGNSSAVGKTLSTETDEQNVEARAIEVVQESREETLLTTTEDYVLELDVPPTEMLAMVQSPPEQVAAEVETEQEGEGEVVMVEIKVSSPNSSVEETKSIPKTGEQQVMQEGANPPDDVEMVIENPQEADQNEQEPIEELQGLPPTEPVDNEQPPEPAQVIDVEHDEPAVQLNQVAVEGPPDEPMVVEEMPALVPINPVAEEAVVNEGFWVQGRARPVAGQLVSNVVGRPQWYEVAEVYGEHYEQGRHFMPTYCIPQWSSYYDECRQVPTPNWGVWTGVLRSRYDHAWLEISSHTNGKIVVKRCGVFSIVRYDFNGGGYPLPNFPTFLSREAGRGRAERCIPTMEIPRDSPYWADLLEGSVFPDQGNNVGIFRHSRMDSIDSRVKLWSDGRIEVIRNGVRVLLRESLN